jgi:hypothetical protein
MPIPGGFLDDVGYTMSIYPYPLQQPMPAFQYSLELPHMSVASLDGPGLCGARISTRASLCPPFAIGGRGIWHACPSDAGDMVSHNTNDGGQAQEHATGSGSQSPTPGSRQNGEGQSDGSEECDGQDEGQGDDGNLDGNRVSDRPLPTCSDVTLDDIVRCNDVNIQYQRLQAAGRLLKGEPIVVLVTVPRKGLTKQQRAEFEAEVHSRNFVTTTPGEVMTQTFLQVRCVC